METNLSQKVADFFVCNFCNYKTSKKSDFNKHLLTGKHKNNENGNILETKKSQKSQTFILQDLSCSYCSKMFGSRSGLYKHTIKCKKNNNLFKNEDVSSGDIVIKLLDDNKEMRKIMIKQQEQLSELIPQIGSNNNNTTNNKLNINVFLNEHCKDALNMNEFIQSIQVSLEQLEYTKKHGLEQGLSRTIMENINKLSLYERPLHCTDIKRETLYIKNEDAWEKDETKSKIKKAIKDVSDKQFKSIKKWTNTNPDFQDDINKQEYFAKALSVLGQDNKDVDTKVIKKICNNYNLKNLIKD